MTEYVDQLNELNDLLNDLVEYSPTNGYLLQCLLKKYDAVIEHLYGLSNSKFQASVETIGILEHCINQIFSKKVTGTQKKSIYITAKYILKTSIYIDLRNYKQHLLLDHIIYN
ncbi:MAG: hypothetical protein AAGC65_19375 [Mucilaginibacter sp.]|uniref:hypothetical protein n=1 Tax=Mucilaginibacter sp. TaxID=1882438 RepID=UPI00319F23CC